VGRVENPSKVEKEKDAPAEKEEGKAKGKIQITA